MYIGRFAPSPTGPLHFGSLLAALSSYLDARHNNGKWLLRIDDIDPLREVQGASRDIVTTLKAHHLLWDENIRFQSKRSSAYHTILNQLLNQQKLYYCDCSRKSIRTRTTTTVYDNYCRLRKNTDHQDSALRYMNDGLDIQWKDGIQGLQCISHQQIGDFILKRRDSLWAYHLAVAVDDADQQISHIVRGSDLLAESAKQITLIEHLKFPAIKFSHIPIALSRGGQKLSKQNFATAIDKSTPAQNIFKALTILGQSPPADLLAQELNQILSWAEEHWNIADVPSVLSIVSEEN